MRKTLGESVKLWIKDADGKIVETESLINDKAELQKGCFSIKWCPNISLRFSLGRKGKKLSLLLIELLKRGGELPSKGYGLPMPPISWRKYNGDDLDFESRNKIKEDIIQMLLDEETRLIGICGMGGVGKTTLAKQVIQKVHDSHKHLFPIQVICTVSNSPNFHDIQEQVAQMLGSSLKDVEGNPLRAQHLQNAFSNKKVVVLLDDVWEKFDLNDFGFPFTKSDVGCFCKIIYTSRYENLWSDLSHEIFSLEILLHEEALNLFTTKVKLSNDDKDFHQKDKIVREIVDKCKGLPLALNTAGGALINKATHQWDNMLNRLKYHNEHIDVVHEVLKASYDFLEKPNEKFVFLLCCLFREDAYIPVETLYRYAVGLQLFENTTHIREISVGVHSIVDDLIIKSLLIKVKDDDDGNRVVKIHDVVRDVGISIGKQEDRFISLQLWNNGLEVLDKMESRVGSKLELLRLDNSSSPNGSNIKISKFSFKEADNLKVLDTVSRYSEISEFPLFFSKLKMLSLERLIYLDMKTNISSIGHIKCLEILSLRNSVILVLPNEISELTNLRLLDLNGCDCFINNGVLSKLTNLQELYMWNSFQDWRIQREDVNGGDNHAGGLDELNCLPKLWKLELEIFNIEQVPRDVRLFSSSTLLEQFKIRIGAKFMRDIRFESGKRQLWLKNSSASFLNELGALIKKDITNLCISNDLGMWEKMYLHNFLSLLREVVLTNCGSIITLFPPSQSSMEIEEINGLGRYLWRIEIYGCNQMRHLCSTSISRNLTNLKVLVLQDCEMTEEVVNFCDKTEQLNKIEFNALETLVLRHLSRMESFCRGINEIYFHKLKTLRLTGLKNFIFPAKVEIPCLEILNISSIPNIETLPIVAPFLNKLYINSCDSLRYVFSKSYLSISHLEKLSIKECKMLKGLIGVSKGVEEESKKSIELPNLKKLNLAFLDKLMSFVMDINNLDVEEKKLQQQTLFDRDEVSFPCLYRLVINGLSKINYIVGWKEGERHHHHHDKIFPALKELLLLNLSNLIHIYEINQPELGELLFQNVSYLRVDGCGKLRYLFSENICTVSARHLRHLEIRHCPMLEVVMKNIEDDDDDKAGGGEGSNYSLGNTHFLPLLMIVYFWNLSGLRRFSDVAYTWALLSLENLRVSKCPKLEALSPGYLDSPRLDTLRYNYDREVNVKDTWKGDINAALRHYIKHSRSLIELLHFIMLGLSMMLLGFTYKEDIDVRPFSSAEHRDIVVWFIFLLVLMETQAMRRPKARMHIFAFLTGILRVFFLLNIV
ncbi:probable disease resistance protein At4g27220 [Impatiens glandulifera]|uniref:probable disease resistance protein At4g27220 n=1 Tax=Impatiens glandulifera TaxID=253017 RepID=UPI001FB08244|nr:probable disease resistance protein At4g27220 [Impatiens glandulifera]